MLRVQRRGRFTSVQGRQQGLTPYALATFGDKRRPCVRVKSRQLVLFLDVAERKSVLGCRHRDHTPAVGRFRLT